MNGATWRAGDLIIAIGDSSTRGLPTHDQQREFDSILNREHQEGTTARVLRELPAPALRACWITLQPPFVISEATTTTTSRTILAPEVWSAWLAKFHHFSLNASTITRLH